MRKIYTLVIAIILANTIKAQNLQFVNNQFLTNGIVDATKQDLYTYKNISTNSTPAAVNFEIKKLNTVTNQFDMVHSFPNPQLFVNHYPLTVINKKFLLHGDFKSTNGFGISATNLYAFDGANTYDSLFTKSDLLTSTINPFYTDTLNQLVYFSVVGSPSVSGIYKSDFTKLGTTKIKAIPQNPYGKITFEGLGSTLYMNVKITNAAFQTKNYLIKYENGTETIIDSTAQLFYDMHKDKTNNELYVVATNFLNKEVRKITASGTVTLLTTINSSIGRMFGKINNKLLFTSASNNGMTVLDLSANTTSNVFATGTSNEPIGFNSINDVVQTPSGNYFYLKSNNTNTSLNKIWVTDGITITKADSSVYASNNTFVNVANNFCGDNMISMDYVSFNNISIVTTTPAGTASKQCVASSVPTWNCVTTGQYTTNTALYVVGNDNLYKSTNCSSASAISAINKTTTTIYPNPTSNTLNIEGSYGTYELVNTLGQIVKIFTTSNDKISIDVSDLMKGVYILKSSNGIITKLIKE